MHQLYGDHHGWLHRKLGCAHNAADVTQDTFLRIIASRDALLGLLADHGEGYPSPEQTLATLEALAQIGAALDGLPDKARQAFLLHFLDGETQAATAARLEVSTKTVQRYLAQALLQCQRILD